MSIQIIYEENSKTARIEGLDENLIPILSKKLSFKKDGVEYTQAYKNYLQYIEDKHFDENAKPRGAMWDGITRLLTKKLKFPCGLVEYVANYLRREFAQEIEIIDNRKFSKKDFDINIDETLIYLKKTPRDYQINAVNKMLENRRGIIKSATGSGKTQIAAMAVAAIGKKANIYVIGTDLLYSFHEYFSKVLPFKIGIIGDGVCDIQNVNIVSIWTAGRVLGMKDKDILDDDMLLSESFDINDSAKIKTALKSAKVHILDECHIATCETINKICDAINPEHIYGLSGTPFRMDDADLLIKGMLGEEIIDIKASYLIKRNVLAKPIIKFVKVPKIKSSKKNYQQLYKEYIIENDVRNNLIVDETKKLLSKGYVVLVLFNNIRHGEVLSELFENSNIEFGVLNGKDDIIKRKEIMQDITDGKLNCIIASRIFDIGIDVPRLSGLVLAGSGKSYVRTMQRIGRVIRSYPNKKNAAIVDFDDQVVYFKNHSAIRKRYYQTEEEFKII